MYQEGTEQRTPDEVLDAFVAGFLAKRSRRGDDPREGVATEGTPEDSSTVPGAAKRE